MTRLRYIVTVIAVSGALTSCAPERRVSAENPRYIDIQPVVRTQAVANDPDDPSIWVHPSDPSRSIVIATNKVKAPDGAVVVYGLDGSTKQTISNLDRPNNVDVEYGIRVADQTIDIAVAAERLKNQLRVFRIHPDGSGITDITSEGNTRVFADRTGENAAPMGIALYKRPRDSAIFAIVAPKDGPADGYLAQYRLENDQKGRIKATFVRYFGAYSRSKEIEAVAVDDALGYVYYADEGNGIHKYHADPDHPDAARELAHFGTSGFRGDREGIAIYANDDGTGFVVCTDQLENATEYHVFRREGEAGNPHDHSKVIAIIRGGADSTDGLEITSKPLGPNFPNGAIVAMNSKDKNFLMYRWPEALRAGSR